MALTTTTLSSAVVVDDRSIVVASATGFEAGSYIRVDDEWMQILQSYTSGTTIPVKRGVNGSITAAHVASANVTVGEASDFDGAPSGVASAVTVPSQRARRVKSYSAAGAIELPKAGEDMVAILNGTSAIAMTVAAPPKDIDGSMLIILGNDKSASTLTFTDGVGDAGSGYDVLTLQNAGQVGAIFMAANGHWVLIGGPPITGTTTALSMAIA